jgi:SPP1 family predicted phage head-tail adaptor
MTAGARRHRCELQSRVDVVDEIGQPSTSWITVRMVHGNIKYLNGLSTIKSGADTSITKCSIRVPHGAFNAGQRLLYGNEVFEIETIIPDGRRKEIDLVCVVINADV